MSLEYFFSTDHKVIGPLYGFSSLFFLLAGLMLVMMIVHLSSKDVVHSFALPQMRVKQDAVPGVPQHAGFLHDPDAARVRRVAWLPKRRGSFRNNRDDVPSLTTADP